MDGLTPKISAVRPISSRRTAERTGSAARRVLSAGSVSVGMRTPLSAIGEFLDIGVERCAGNAHQAADLRRRALLPNLPHKAHYGKA